MKKRNTVETRYNERFGWSKKHLVISHLVKTKSHAKEPNNYKSGQNKKR